MAGRRPGHLRRERILKWLEPACREWIEGAGIVTPSMSVACENAVRAREAMN
jgi:hypothetical protein